MTVANELLDGVKEEEAPEQAARVSEKSLDTTIVPQGGATSKLLIDKIGDNNGK